MAIWMMAGEYFVWSVVNGTNTLDVVVGSAFDWSSDSLYARFRLFSSPSSAPGGTLTQADSVGEALDGEVEDYQWDAGTLPVTLNSFSSEGAAGGRMTVRWQTASETDNVGFEVWGMVGGKWYALGDFVPSSQHELPHAARVRDRDHGAAPALPASAGRLPKPRRRRTPRPIQGRRPPR